MPLRPKAAKKGARRALPGGKRKTMKITTTVPVRKPKPQQKATILDVVNRMLNRKTETKYIGQYSTTSALPTGISPFGPGVFENVVQTLGERATTQFWNVALPAQIQAGLSSTSAADYNRIGDKIEPVKHQVKMTIRFAQKSMGGDPPSYQAQDVPLDLTVYVFYGYIKSMKTYQGNVSYIGRSAVVDGQQEAVKAMNNLLDDGDGTFSTFTGDPILAQQPLSDYVDMKVKKIHLRRAAGWINTNANNGGAAPNGDSQNTLSKTIVLKFKPKAKLIYKTATDLYPENYAPVYALGYVFNDATASTNNQSPDYLSGQVEYVAQNQLWFKDHQ